MQREQFTTHAKLGPPTEEKLRHIMPVDITISSSQFSIALDCTLPSGFEVQKRKPKSLEERKKTLKLFTNS
jgi:hypothetical protein